MPQAAFGAHALVVGSSPVFLRAVWELFVVGAHEVTVLIEGETGTGKELFSRALHDVSPRRDGPFLAVNCCALPRELLESELFGHNKGAFTGADQDRRGLVENAAGGTLFLDEISSMDMALQAKLLRFLDGGVFRRVGDARRERAADVRIVAASNVELEAEIEAGRFRADLYYRLAVYPLSLPPLRERSEDISALVRYFLARYASRFSIDPPIISDEALDTLRRHDWPGNVRELQNALTQAALRSSGRPIEVSDLPPKLRQASPPVTESPTGGSFQEQKAALIEQFERHYLRKLLATHAGNVTQSAQAAGKHRRALTELLRKHEIDPDAFRRTGTK